MARAVVAVLRVATAPRRFAEARLLLGLRLRLHLGLRLRLGTRHGRLHVRRLRTRHLHRGLRLGRHLLLGWLRAPTAPSTAPVTAVVLVARGPPWRLLLRLRLRLLRRETRLRYRAQRRLLPAFVAWGALPTLVPRVAAPDRARLGLGLLLRHRLRLLHLRLGLRPDDLPSPAAVVVAPFVAAEPRGAVAVTAGTRCRGG